MSSRLTLHVTPSLDTAPDMVDEAAAAAAVVVADSERPAACAATDEVRSAAFFLPIGVYEYWGRTVIEIEIKTTIQSERFMSKQWHQKTET